jgi:Na+/H+-translocating membrane pyrophosphatase
LKKEYTFLWIWLLFFSLVVLIAVDQPWRDDRTCKRIPYTMIAYLVGATTSMSAGTVGMLIATSANVKVTYLCNYDPEKALRVAYAGGQVLGFFLVSASLTVINIMILSYKPGILWSLGAMATRPQITA